MCANEQNKKCARFYTLQNSGLDNDWASSNWCNPPYSDIKAWLAEQLKGNLTVMIIPARTDAAFFHDFIYQKEKVEVRFARGRLRFGDSKQNAPFPSMVVIFHPFR